MNNFLNLREFMAFSAVMKTGTTIGAAKALNLSQPSVSRLLNDLEARFQMVLFRRVRGRLVATEQADVLLDEVERAFDGLKQLSEFTGKMRRPQTRPLRLVISPSLSYRFAPAALALFARKHPALSVIVEMRTMDLVTELIAGDMADVSVNLLPVEHPGVRVIPLLDVPTVCVVPRNNPLAKRKVINPATLKQEPLIQISRRYPARIRVDQVFEAAGITPQISVETGTSAAACGCAAAGLGIALINALAAKEYEGPQTRIIPFEPMIRNSFGIIRPRRPVSGPVMDLIECLRQAAFNQVGAFHLDPG